MDMRKFGFLFTILLFTLGLQAQLGTKTPYVPLQHSYTPPPQGYTPFFVNYVGRHGARYLTKASADVQVLQVLQAAEKHKGLTAEGVRIRIAAERLAAAGKGNYERITLLGAEEQEAIGERMLYNYTPVFKGRGLTIVTTWKLRTQQSAEAFLRAFGTYTGGKQYERAVDSLDTVLRFYDLSPEYLRYKKSSLLKKAEDSLDKDIRTARVAADVCGRVFTQAYITQVMQPVAMATAFTDDLYDLYCIAFSMGGELRQQGYTSGTSDLGAAFSHEDLLWLDQRSGAADFLEKGPGYDPSGIQVTIAAPLLADFIRSSDKAVAGTGGDAVLRFTHAEAISPFAALLGIQGASSPAASIFGYQDQWRAESVIPLSANIQWVFYGDGKQVLVKVLLNEKEVSLPLKPLVWPYYRWEDVRAFYAGVLVKR